MEDFDFPMYGDSWWKVHSVLQTPPVQSVEASETALTRLDRSGLPRRNRMESRSVFGSSKAKEASASRKSPSVDSVVHGRTRDA